MSTEEFCLEDLPPELQRKLGELALTMGCSEEEIVVKMVRLVLNLCDHPSDPGLQEFVCKAEAALKHKNQAG